VPRRLFEREVRLPPPAGEVLPQVGEEKPERHARLIASHAWAPYHAVCVPVPSACEYCCAIQIPRRSPRRDQRWLPCYHCLMPPPPREVRRSRRG